MEIKMLLFSQLKFKIVILRKRIYFSGFTVLQVSNIKTHIQAHVSILNKNTLTRQQTFFLLIFNRLNSRRKPTNASSVQF